MDNSLLTCWMEPPAGKVRLRSALELLNEMTLGLSDGRFDDNVRVAAAGNPGSAWTLSRRLIDNEGSSENLLLSRCWMWVAASLGHREAISEIAACLMDEVASGSAALSTQELSALSSTWIREGAHNIRNQSPRGFVRAPRMAPPQTVDIDFHEAEDELPPFSADVEAGSISAPIRPLDPVILESVGDPNSTIGRELCKRYRSIIGKRMPLGGTIPNVDRLIGEIQANWPWASNLARWLEGQFSLIQNFGPAGIKLPNLLLVGPSGSGKTSILEWLAERCELPSTTVSIAGTSDSAGLAAIARGWLGSQPCLPVRMFEESGVRNPCIILDELDKGVRQTSGSNGSAAGTLLSMTEPSSNGFTDTSLLSKVKLNDVIWLASANELRSIPKALLDRFMPILIPAPGAEHFDGIFDGVVSKSARALGISPDFMPTVSRSDRHWMRSVFVQSGCSIRSLQQAYQVVSGERAREERLAMRPEMLN